MKKQQSVLCFCFVFFLSTNCFLCIAQGIFLWLFLHCIIMYFSLLSSWCFSLTLFIYFTLMVYQSPSFLYTFSCLHSTTFFPFILPILFTKFTKSIPPCFCYFKLQFSSAVNFSPSQLHTEVCFLSHCWKACPSYSFPLHNFNFVHRRKNKIVIGWHSSLNEKGYFRSCWCLVINKESLLCKYLSVVQLNSNRRYLDYKSKNSFSCGGSGVLGHM